MADPNGREDYFLGHRQEEQERLQQQAEQLASDAVRLFDDIGVSSGDSVLEIGCGPRGCLDLLSKLVGPEGTVTGLEISEEAVALAQKFVADTGLTNIEVIAGDARSAVLPNAPFDLVTARLVLVNVPDPAEIVVQAVALAKPGGVVAFHEVDWECVVCDPPSPAWTGLVDLFSAFSEKNGNDLFIGRKVPRLLRESGLVDVRATPIIHAHPPDNPRRRILLTFADNLRERILADDLISAEAFDELKDAFGRHIDDPDTFVLAFPYVQAWGRKPT